MAYDNRRSNGDYGRKSYNRGGYGQKDFERDIARDSKPYKKPDGRKPYGKKFDDRQDKPYKKFDDKREDRPFKDKPFKAQEGEKTANTQEVSGKEERKQIRDKKDGKKKFMMKQKKKE